MDSLDIVGLPAFADNYIWVLRRGTSVACVDPGDAAPLLDYLQTTGTRLAAILVTHHHHDHVDGIADILDRHAAPVYGPAAENIPGVSQAIAGGDRVELAELGEAFDVLALPGHTRGHVAYYRRGMLFCGDTLFGAGCGRLFEGTAAQMHASLARIKALPPDTRIYCAHEYTAANLRFAAAVEPGNAAVRARIDAVARLRERRQPTVPSLLSEELATNPFLREDAPEVVSAAAARLGRQPASPVEAFASIREWKNIY
jgi:hydroxyacylglutathione hydrolase